MSEVTAVDTADGERLEAIWSPALQPLAVAVVTHPHPLMGGDLHNAVPAGLARGLPPAGVSVLRVNFRGTGASTGAHGGGPAEIDDVVAAAQVAAELAPGVPVVAVGYSFGADVVLAAPAGTFAAVVAVAPPLRILPVDDLRRPRGDAATLVLSPEHDQICGPAEAAERTAGWPGTTVEAISGTDHLLGGRIDAVVERTARFLVALP